MRGGSRSKPGPDDDGMRRSRHKGDAFPPGIPFACQLATTGKRSRASPEFQSPVYSSLKKGPKGVLQIETEEEEDAVSGNPGSPPGGRRVSWHSGWHLGACFRDTCAEKATRCQPPGAEITLGGLRRRQGRAIANCGTFGELCRTLGTAGTGSALNSRSYL